MFQAYKASFVAAIQIRARYNLQNIIIMIQMGIAVAFVFFQKVKYKLGGKIHSERFSQCLERWLPCDQQFQGIWLPLFDGYIVSISWI